MVGVVERSTMQFQLFFFFLGKEDSAYFFNGRQREKSNTNIYGATAVQLFAH